MSPVVFFAVVCRPWLWRAALRSAPNRWWLRRPFLPLPSESYRRFRSATQYGGAGDRFDADDVIRFLRWARKFPPAK